MSEVERLKTAPWTNTSADYLVKHVFGHKNMSVADFAQTFPRNARIIDVAAGTCDFGVVMASLRDDIFWTYLDVKDYDSDEAESLRTNIPNENVKFITADIFDPETTRQIGRYDRGYTHAYLKHLLKGNESDRQQARRAADFMLNTLRDNGVFGFDASRHPALSRAGLRPKAIYLGKYASDIGIEDMLDSASLPPSLVRWHNAMNTTGISVMSAKRFNPATRGLFLFEHQDGLPTKDPVSLFSSRGAHLLGKLGAAYLHGDAAK
ncbi:MAG TPA: hypothetical protein VH234_01815 [Candidatus Saccharimonadales bacterium]|jgi:hypothetical protein|nr:hypothetical protein [Candidatus Saccharimonadales bacterium]